MSDSLVDMKLKALPIFAQSFCGIVDNDPSGVALVREFRRSCFDNDLRPTAWCAAFAHFCISRIDAMFGGETTCLPNTEWVHDLITVKRVVPGPKPGVGYIGVWSKVDKDGKPTIYGHCEIVNAYDEGGSIATIGGNTSMWGITDREVGCVAEKMREKGQVPGYILVGYVPPWKEKES